MVGFIYLISFFLSLSLPIEENSDEIKIGTSCKNGGCTKVGELLCSYKKGKLPLLSLLLAFDNSS